MSNWIKNLFSDADSGNELSETDDIDIFATDDSEEEETSDYITFEDDSEEDSGLSLFGEVEEEEDNNEEEDEEENFAERMLEDWRKGHEEIMQSLDDKRSELQAKIDELKMQRGMK